MSTAAYLGCVLGITISAIAGARCFLLSRFSDKHREEIFTSICFGVTGVALLLALVTGCATTPANNEPEAIKYPANTVYPAPR